ncbi:hypothetical protein OsI_23965 [Oryza sativa Indica Group]|uniref:Uncharacterized protein n=1 Tax=Oryza sativa subsp. indica TaxID=39946 RepID=B8B0Y7_ORYSI|nr:hypothetical protein OsI_23965 [Oryza sativa Indica Group]
MGAWFRVGRIAAAARVLWRGPTPASAPSEVRERLAVETVKLFSPVMNQQDRSFWSYLIGYNCGALIILGNANRELDQRAKALAEEREAL